MIKHWAIFIDNDSDKQGFISGLLSARPPELFEALASCKGMLFSKSTLRSFIEKEDRHGFSKLSATSSQAIKTMSSGEQKKALLLHVLSAEPDFIILDNPFDNLDSASQEGLHIRLKEIAKHTILIQLLSRKVDLLPFIGNHARLEKSALVQLMFDSELPSKGTHFEEKIPEPLSYLPYDGEVLIQLKNVSVSYMEKPVLEAIDWTIKKREFWELRGPNGSGKTTILSMVTGENPKGYGQELYIFGRKKGSGESVWDIKKRIGYFSPALTDSFTGYHSVEHMLISGLNDSVGLYIEPTEAQLRLAKEWLVLLKLWRLKDRLFHDLSAGQQRLVMCARAMIKHPTLLILDEPTAGLDDSSAAFFVALVNKFAKESETAIIFVSHRKEPGLSANFIYELNPTENGSIGMGIKKRAL